MNVLSLFDGMSCGQIALDELGVQIGSYYASEVDKYAIKVTKKNYPNTKQIGNVKNITEEFIKEISPIDLLIGGSPCQNLSPAVIHRDNYNQGLEGEKSSLFYEFVRVFDLVRKYNSDFKFLFENVAGMSDKDKSIISKTFGIEPIMINSNLFSVQDRKRYYWTNINIGELPAKSNEVLKDIIQPYKEVEEWHNSGRMNFIYNGEFDFYGLDNKVAAELKIKGHDILKRVYSPNFKCATLTACNGGNTQKKVIQNGKCRKLTPLEYERLQTVPDNYTSAVSNSQRYNMLGNGWTVEVIKHIFKNLEEE